MNDNNRYIVVAAIAAVLIISLVGIVIVNLVLDSKSAVNNNSGAEYIVSDPTNKTDNTSSENTSSNNDNTSNNSDNTLPDEDVIPEPPEDPGHILVAVYEDGTEVYMTPDGDIYTITPEPERPSEEIIKNLENNTNQNDQPADNKVEIPENKVNRVQTNGTGTAGNGGKRDEIITG